MSANSKIEWTDHTFNPWIGCTKVSPACDHCYAEVSTPSRTLGVVWGPHAERRRTSAGNWAMPKRWNAQAGAFQVQHGRRQRVFCASLADVFDNAVPAQWRADLFTLIASTPNLDWLLLTKRIGNVKTMLAELAHGSDEALSLLDMMPLPNLWLGATIANQDEADRDIPKLLSVPAAKRFLSMEPLLGPVDLTNIAPPSVEGREWHGIDSITPANRQLRGCIDWVIVGGESGQHARPMHPDWARSLRDQCQAAGVPFFFKQHGEWIGVDDLRGLAGGQCPGFGAYDHCQFDRQHEAVRVGKKAAGRLLDGHEWSEVPR